MRFRYTYILLFSCIFLINSVKSVCIIYIPIICPRPTKTTTTIATTTTTTTTTKTTTQPTTTKAPTTTTTKTTTAAPATTVAAPATTVAATTTVPAPTTNNIPVTTDQTTLISYTTNVPVTFTDSLGSVSVSYSAVATAAISTIAINSTAVSGVRGSQNPTNVVAVTGDAKSSSDADEKARSDKNNHVGVIVGSVGGAVALIAAGLAYLFYVRYKQDKDKRKYSEENIYNPDYNQEEYNSTPPKESTGYGYSPMMAAAALPAVSPPQVPEKTTRAIPQSDDFYSNVTANVVQPPMVEQGISYYGNRSNLNPFSSAIANTQQPGYTNYMAPFNYGDSANLPVSSNTEIPVDTKPDTPKKTTLNV